MPERKRRWLTRLACGKAPTGSGARELSKILFINSNRHQTLFLFKEPHLAGALHGEFDHRWCGIPTWVVIEVHLQRTAHDVILSKSISSPFPQLFGLDVLKKKEASLGGVGIAGCIRQSNIFVRYGFGHFRRQKKLLTRVLPQIGHNVPAERRGRAKPDSLRRKTKKDHVADKDDKKTCYHKAPNPNGIS